MLAEGALEVRIELAKGSAEAEDDRTGLAGEAATTAVDEDVDLAFGVGVLQDASGLELLPSASASWSSGSTSCTRRARPSQPAHPSPALPAQPVCLFAEP